MQLTKDEWRLVDKTLFIGWMQLQQAVAMAEKDEELDPDEKKEMVTKGKKSVDALMTIHQKIEKILEGAPEHATGMGFHATYAKGGEHE